MALHGFQIHPPSTVILDDDRNPDVSWANHEARYPGQTNRGGVDVVAPVGTPVHAWADGTVRNLANQGSAGNVVHLDLAHDPGWSMEAKHLSRFAVPNGQWVARGSVIGYSGTSGGVAPHVHYNLLDPRGIRRNPWHYTENGSASAGTVAAPPERKLMDLVANGNDWYLYGPGGIVHVNTNEGLDGVRAVLSKTVKPGLEGFQQIKAAESFFKKLRTGY